jgi:hypothetical protein
MMTKKEISNYEKKKLNISSDTVTFIDGYEWENRQKKLIPQNNLGSVIDLNESGFNTRMSRLASIHNRQAQSIEQTENNHILNRYDYLNEQFHWLEEFIPEKLLDQIFQLMAYSRTQRKIAKELAGLNLQDLSLILAFWELDVYPLGNYIVEEVLQDINDYLRTYSNNFKKRGIISIKDIQMAQEIILSDLYALEFNTQPQCFKKIPKEALRYYRSFLYIFEKELPSDFAQKVTKARDKRPDLLIPASVYIWVVRKKILQAMLPFLVMKLNLNQVSFEGLRQYTENFWSFVFHQKAVGDLPTIGLLLIETWQKAQTKPLPVRLTSLHKVEKFKTRIKAYRRRFERLMYKALPQELQVKKNKEDQIKELRNQIHQIEKWLSQFDSNIEHKLIRRSTKLKETFTENLNVLNNLQKELNQLTPAKLNQSVINEYKTLQHGLMGLIVEILDSFQTLMVGTSEKLVKTKRLLHIEEAILPDLNVQIQSNRMILSNLDRSSSILKEEFNKTQESLIQVQQHFDVLEKTLKQKIDAQIDFHLINNPLPGLLRSKDSSK